MQELETTLPAADAGEFQLGMMLGTRKAFAAVAGRCSAADAECLRRICDQKLYLSRAASWEEFCPEYLGLSNRHANRIIRNLEEFGPDYFELAQLTRITPGQFRAIAPAIREKNIHVDGQAIALIPENSERVAAAVSELRRAAAPPAASMDERLSVLSRQVDRLLAEFEKLFRCPASLEENSQMARVLDKAAGTFRALELLRPRRR